MIRIGPTTKCCRVCTRDKELRMGVCFDCADLVSGVQIDSRKHELFETKNPNNCWIYSEYAR